MSETDVMEKLRVFMLLQWSTPFSVPMVDNTAAAVCCVHARCLIKVTISTSVGAE